VRMPAASQWKGGKAPGQEGDPRSYNLVSGRFLEDLLANLISVFSLTHPEGAKMGAATPQPQPSPAPPPAPQPAPQQQPVSAELETFFKYKGWIGPRAKKSADNTKWTYVGYRVK